MKGVFLGPHGPRAGWRFLLYVGLWGAVWLLLEGALHWAKLGEPPQIWQDMIEVGLRLAAAISAAGVMAVMEKRTFGTYGLPRRSAFRGLFWVGAVWGILSVSVLIFSIGGAGDFRLGGLALHGASILKFAAFWGVFFLLVGFFEEFLFRGYTQFTLTQWLGFWPAAFLLSFIFGITHLGNSRESWIGACAVGCFALFFCLTLRRTGNLWFAVGFHAAFDWGESYLYSVPDSGEVSPGHLFNSSFHGSRWMTGGAVGPEGSILVFVVLALMWVLFRRQYPDVKYGRGTRPKISANDVNFKNPVSILEPGDRSA